MTVRSRVIVVASCAAALVVAAVSCPGTASLEAPLVEVEAAACEATNGAALVRASCAGCHSASRTGPQRAAAPAGVNFDTDGDLQRWAIAIHDVTIVRKTMPPGAPLSDCDRTALDSYVAAIAAGACLASCSGRPCGDDHCGGSCGSCSTSQRCDPTYGQCREVSCSPNCIGKSCGDDGCGGTSGSCAIGKFCDAAQQCSCQPQCAGLHCGPDGCGGLCGQCAANEQCSQTGQCVCIPDCGGKECGDDGCGGTCGACGDDEVCSNTFICRCAPSCPTSMKCGTNACGTSCGACSDPAFPVCVTTSSTSASCAASCAPSCAAKSCGGDGCGGSCGTCAAGELCSNGQCVCAPSCGGKTCGPDGCGGGCGVLDGGCAAGLSCTGGQCACAPNCAGRVCGSDGCGGACAPGCGAGQTCNSAGQCVCAPQCSGKSCGPDGCGGVCGSCSAGASCNSAGQCLGPTKSYATDVSPLFQPKCATGGCHTGGTTEPLDLRTASAGYASLVNKSSTQCTPSKLFVKPGDVAASYLMNKLSGQGICSGSSMPKGSGSLTASELEIIRAWISGGAKP